MTVLLVNASGCLDALTAPDARDGLRSDLVFWPNHLVPMELEP